MIKPLGKVLITGGSGRLGACVVGALRSVAEPATFDLSDDGGADAHFTGTVMSAEDLAAAAVGADAMVHTAALLSRGHPPSAIFSVNAVGTWNALEAAEAAGCSRFVYISSECTTGLCVERDDLPPAFLPIDESYTLRPIDAYGVSKQTGELICEAFRRRSKMRVVVLRPVLILFQSHRAEIAERQALRHRDLWGYVEPEDVADAVVASLTREKVSPVYFLSAPDTLCETPTLDLMRQRFGKLPPVTRADVFANNPTAAVFDISLAREELGFAPSSTWRRYQHGGTVGGAKEGTE
jgi:nucleoside-diphosphate-sugar epimerase